METTSTPTSTPTPTAVKVVWSDGSKQLVLSSSVTVGQLLSELRCRSPASTADGFHVAADTPLAALRDTPLHLTADKSNTTTASADSSALPSPPGHLFLVRSDVRYLLTDAWLVNSLGSWHGVNRHWVPEGSPSDMFGAAPEPSPGFDFVRRVKSWPPCSSSTQPVPYVCNSPRLGPRFDHYLKICREFVALATSDLRASGAKPRNRRQLYLLSLPLLSTGMAGMRLSAGKLITTLIPLLEELAELHCVDIVLVLFEESLYSMAQAFRRRAGSLRSFALLSPEDRMKAEELAVFAERDSLSLFVGAGVSVGAGLPSWGSLLEKIAAAAGMSSADTSRLWNLNFQDQARLLQSRLGSADKLRETIQRLVSSVGFSLNHAMLAQMPCETVITTNYDDLFEKASTAGGTSLPVLPYEAGKGGRILLKLHGCVNHPSDIVLTREDYLSFGARRQALGSILQAAMIRTHLLFVGFSLIDENYIRLADAVSQVAPKNVSNGTALFLFSNAFEADLNSSLTIHAMMPPLPPGEKENAVNAPPAARKLEIFIDYLLMLTCNTTHHLLDPSFKEFNTPEEKQLSDMLRTILNDTPLPVQETIGFKKLRFFVVSTFGGAEDFLERDPIAIPFLVKQKLTLGKFVKRIQSTYLLQFIAVYAKNHMTMLKERNAETYPNQNVRMADLFSDGDVVKVKAETFLHHMNEGGKTFFGFSSIGKRERVVLAIKLFFKADTPKLEAAPKSPNASSGDLAKPLSPPPDLLGNEGKKKPPQSRQTCKFWLKGDQGSCRAGFACALEHIGVPLTESGIIALEEQAAAAAAADNNNNNNDVVVEVNQQLQAQIQLPKPSASWAAPQKKKSVPTQMNPEHVRASEEAVAGVVNILDVKKVSEK